MPRRADDRDLNCAETGPPTIKSRRILSSLGGSIPCARRDQQFAMATLPSIAARVIRVSPARFAIVTVTPAEISMFTDPKSPR